MGEKSILLAVLFSLLAVRFAVADGLHVTGIKAEHRNGQTFVTWMDVAADKSDTNYRYTLYRSSEPIAQDNFQKAEKRIWNINAQSAKLYSYWFANYLSVPWGHYCAIENGGKPLPTWSGLAVVTPDKPADSYYAVVATDCEGNIVTAIQPGQSATTQPVHETVAPIQPIRMWDSTEQRDPQLPTDFGHISGKKGMALMLQLHGGGGEFVFGRLQYGDFYLLFGPREMGYYEGLQSVFDVDEENNKLILAPSAALMSANGDGYWSTWWGGYFCMPQWAPPRSQVQFYPFTHRELDYMVRWSIDRYQADPNHVYCRGGSIGGNGTWNYGFHRPDLFAAIYPMAGKITSLGIPMLKIDDAPYGKVETFNTTVAGDKLDYTDWYDSVRYASEHHADLPFVGWSCGRFDAARGWVTFSDNVAMVKALEKNHQAFAWAWDLGGHGGGYESHPEEVIQKYYPPEKFARNLSSPAFSNSSIDDDCGNGDPLDGTLVGGINLGFDWKEVTDEQGQWAITVSNQLAKADMTVDITPRRCQKFKARSGEKFYWADSTGATGQVTADAWGLVTIPKVKIALGQQTRLGIATKSADKDSARSFKSPPPVPVPPAAAIAPPQLDWVRINTNGRCVVFQFKSAGNPQSAWVKDISENPTILVNGKTSIHLESPVYEKQKIGNNGPIGLPYIIYSPRDSFDPKDKITVSAPAGWVECNGGKMGALSDAAVENYKGKRLEDH